MAAMVTRRGPRSNYRSIRRYSQYEHSVTSTGVSQNLYNVSRNNSASILRDLEGNRRDLVMSVLKTLPSQRDARSYLRKFAPNSGSISKNTNNNQTSLIDSILKPMHNHTALVKLVIPKSRDGNELYKIAGTILTLCKLGLTPIIMVDASTQNTLEAINHVLSLADAIELRRGRVRPIIYGLFEGDRIDLHPLHSAHISQAIPLILPVILINNNLSHQLLDANEAMVRLTMELAKDKETEPIRVMLINEHGGIPSRERKGQAHVFINLASEYETIYKLMDEDQKAEFKMMRDCLDLLGNTASGIMVSYSTSGDLISNIITDKPPFSPSMPTCANVGTTVLRAGQTVHIYDDVTSLDRIKLTALLESSFGKRLLVNEFYDRLSSHLHSAIIVGDYLGAAILTREKPSIMTTSSKNIVYLDKFSVDPRRQGAGIADILWNEMIQRELSQSQVNTDMDSSALSHSIVWRSRSDNGVNKWYFERADGHWRIDGTKWTMFWVGGAGHNGKTMCEWRDVVASIKPLLV